MGNNCCGRKEEINFPQPVDIPGRQGATKDAAAKGLQKDSEKEFHARHEGEVDYDVIDTKGVRDEFEIFEAGLPFARTHFNRFIEAVDLAEQQSGNKGFVTIFALSKQLKTEAWKDLRTQNSTVNRFMTSGIFKDPANSKSASYLNADRLKIFGMLNCRQSIERKAFWLCQFLQESGQQQTAWSDQNFRPNFSAICDLACWDLYTAMDKVKVTKFQYTQSELTQLKEQVDTLLDENFISNLFGDDSRLDFDDFVQKCVDEESVSWVFIPALIRTKLFDQAQIEVKHMKRAAPAGVGNN